MKRPGCLLDGWRLALSGENVAKNHRLGAGIGNENPSSSISVTMNLTSPMPLISYINRWGLFFSKK